MLLSMTGFGEANGDAHGVEYSVEARSVNNRYCKCIIKLPDICSSAEPEVERIVRSCIRRGMVTVAVKLTMTADKAHRINTEVLSQYMEQLRPLETEANPLMRIDLGSLLQLPGACEPSADESVFAETRSDMLDLVQQAIDGLIKMRRQEGRAIAEELLKNVKLIRTRLSVIVERAPQVVLAYQQRLLERVRELTGQAQVCVDQDSIAREVAILSERCDVAEEIARLGAHLDQFEQSVADADEPIGRKLDFIAQELLREANTIAAKANDAEVGKIVVEIKTAVDRIKEQVQNVE